MNDVTTAGPRATLDHESLEPHCPHPARMVLDVEYPLDQTVAALVRDELDRGGSVHVVLVHPRVGWSMDPALVRLREQRIVAAREQRLEELAVIAGDRSVRVSVSVLRERRRPATSSASGSADRGGREGGLVR